MSEKKVKTVWGALASFQQEVPTIHKGTKGYGYSYADLPTIFEVINPLLKKHSLGFTQLIEGQSIKTILFHTESDGRIESITEIPQDVSLKGMNQYQVLGSAITYIRRYALSSMLGIVTDKDTDASGEQAPQPAKAPKAKAKSNFKEGGFEKALNSVFEGSKDKNGNRITKDTIANAYNLTPEQSKQLKEAELTFKNK